MTFSSSPDDNWQRQDATMSILAANLWSIPLMLVAVIVFVVPHGLLWGWDAWLEALVTGGWWWIALPVIIVGLVVHEALHALGWIIAGQISLDDVSFGVRDLTPYAHCKIPLPVAVYRVGTALPALGLGVLPGLVGVALGLHALTAFGALFTGAASGDAMILWLIRNAPEQAYIHDHPSKVGCEVLLPPEVDSDAT